MKIRYTYRLRPGQQARAYLSREWGMCRYVWNRLVDESRETFFWAGVALANGAGKDQVPTFGPAQQSAYLTRLRANTVDETGHRWLAAGSQTAQQQTVRDFSAARTKAMADRTNKVAPTQRRGLPRFKSRHRSLASMNYTGKNFKLTPDPVTGLVRLQLPGKVLIPVVWSRELPAAPSSVRVYQDTLGHWYASFVVDADVTETVPTTGKTVGVDWGVTETATTVSLTDATGVLDEGTAFDLPHAEHGRRAATRLARYQRMIARRQRPQGATSSRGYLAAKVRAAKTAKKVARQRQDDARKWARRVVRARDRVAVEDFKPKFLAKSTMSKKAADAAISATKTELVWQARKHGRDLRLVHPAYTTTDCSNCDARTKHRLTLGERTYTCETCGHVRPRDKNSAAVMIVRAYGRNITTIGNDEEVARAGRHPADAEDVRPEPAAVRATAV